MYDWKAFVVGRGEKRYEVIICNISIQGDLVQMPINICKAFIKFSQICNISDISVGFNRMFTSIRRMFSEIRKIRTEPQIYF